MRIVALCAVAVLACSACDMVKVYQAQIDHASRALEAAHTDAERAAALSDRGRGYSDKARLSFVRNQIGRDEYLRLFALAIADHDRAVGLASSDAQVYFMRGLSHYDRAAWVEGVDTDHAPWLDAARADFSTAVAKDPNHAAAHDYLGMIDEHTGQIDEAISEY